MSLEISAPELLTEFKQAFLIRRVEQRLLSLYSQGKLFGTVHTCIGQEWVGVAVARELCPGDVVFSNHRCHGHFLARTNNVEGLIAEIMGKQTGVCGGRGGSQHLCAPGFFSNGIQGGIAPVAAGVAWSQQLLGAGQIAVVFIGDGTLGEGVLYETFNIASKWRLPLLIVLENNRYAQSTSQEMTLAGDICARAEAFGIGALHADTWDVVQLIAAAQEAVEQVRAGNGPFFLQVDTDRHAAHSKGDDDRDPQLLHSYKERDVLERFQQTDAQLAEQFHKEIEERIERAVSFAEAADYGALGDETEHNEYPAPLSWQPTRFKARDRIGNRIYAALAANMEQDRRIFLLGEDIEGPYGGAFKVTKDLSQRFPGRVRNTPISEAAIVGLGNGLALSGLLPICEIMFGDFLTLAADQFINHAAKFRYMYNEQVRVPLIIRTPMGGKRGYGPTHSQSLEKLFLGIPGTQVLALHHRSDPAAVYDTLLQSVDRPTLMIENKLLYGTSISDVAPAGFVLEQNEDPFPTTRLRPLAQPEVTILCYGGVLLDVEKAVDRLYEEHEIICEIICPVRLYPLNLEPILESVRGSAHLLVVEEGHGFAGFGSEVLAQIQQYAPGALRVSRRLCAPEHPIPACKPLELASLPGEAHVTGAVLEMIRNG